LFYFAIALIRFFLLAALLTAFYQLLRTYYALLLMTATAFTWQMQVSLLHAL
jgi:hypothetical protein